MYLLQEVVRVISVRYLCQPLFASYSAKLRQGSDDFAWSASGLHLGGENGIGHLPCAAGHCYQKK